MVGTKGLPPGKGKYWSSHGSPGRGTGNSGWTRRQRPDGENGRLNELVDGLTTPELTMTKLGKPCYDGLMNTYWNSTRSYHVDETKSPIRNIEYYELAKWYTVEFYFDHNSSEVRIVPKPLNAKQLVGKFDHPNYPDMPIVGDLDADLQGNGDH